MSAAAGAFPLGPLKVSNISYGSSPTAVAPHYLNTARLTQHACCPAVATVQDSKPWCLNMGLPVTWLDVDQPAVMQLKQQLLSAAGAASTASPQPAQHASRTHPQDAAGAGSDSTHSGMQDKAQEQAAAAVQFPLLVDRWRPVAADLSDTSLSSCLTCSGFDKNAPTVWLAEALLYYLPLEQVSSLRPT
jgi:hypothetical protein